jgi:hypothetical protein
MLINLKRGEQIPYERIVEVDYPLVRYSEAGHIKVAELSEDAMVRLEAIGMRWINCTDDDGVATLLPISQVEAIQQIDPPQGSNATTAYVARSLGGKRYHVSRSTYAALSTLVLDDYVDLVDRPDWM